ncbi:unnamed protein product [Lactuca virosa]|uniref:Disease resistance protein At4g27190-like leucine-rich repeats domain-containing protein n=1 Tax=Lactuca virosa TaxID=75947 RepID=A0AAU9NAG6_9ASTR|nr:unnamed protein product [Lactuca virosa]
MPLLCHLEEVKVRDCFFIEVIFNIDLDSVGEIASSSLRNTELREVWELQEVWMIKGANHSRLPIRGFEVVESISIETCKRFRNVFSPTTTNFDLGELTYMKLYGSDVIGRKYGLVECNQGQENTLYQTYLIHSFRNLHNLKLGRNQGVEVIFEIKSTPTSQDNQQRILPHLEVLYIKYMEEDESRVEVQLEGVLDSSQKTVRFPIPQPHSHRIK